MDGSFFSHSPPICIQLAPENATCIGLIFRRVNDSTNLSSAFLLLNHVWRGTAPPIFFVLHYNWRRFMHMHTLSHPISKRDEIFCKIVRSVGRVAAAVATNFHSSMCHRARRSSRTPKRFHLKSEQHTLTWGVESGRGRLSL